jgi:hypothetical protein
MSEMNDDKQALLNEMLIDIVESMGAVLDYHFSGQLDVELRRRGLTEAYIEEMNAQIDIMENLSEEL